MVTSLSFQLSVHPIWFSLYAAVLKNLLNSVTVYSALMQKNPQPRVFNKSFLGSMIFVEIVCCSLKIQAYKIIRFQTSMRHTF